MAGTADGTRLASRLLKKGFADFATCARLRIPPAAKRLALYINSLARIIKQKIAPPNAVLETAAEFQDSPR